MSSTINEKAAGEHVMKVADKQVTTFSAHSIPIHQARKDDTAKLFRDISQELNNSMSPTSIFKLTGRSSETLIHALPLQQCISQRKMDLDYLHSTIVAMYLKLKLRDLDYLSQEEIDKERDRLLASETLTVLNLFQTSIDVLLMMKDNEQTTQRSSLSFITKQDGSCEASKSHGGASNIENNLLKAPPRGGGRAAKSEMETLQDSMKSIEFAPYIYEQQIVQYEADIRNHIKVRHQMNIEIDNLNERIQDMMLEAETAKAGMIDKFNQQEKKMTATFKRLLDQKQSEVNKVTKKFLEQSAKLSQQHRLNMNLNNDINRIKSILNIQSELQSGTQTPNQDMSRKTSARRLGSVASSYIDSVMDTQELFNDLQERKSGKPIFTGSRPPSIIQSEANTKRDYQIKVANRVAFKRTNSIDFDGEQSHSNARLDVNNYQTKCMTRNPSNEELQQSFQCQRYQQKDVKPDAKIRYLQELSFESQRQQKELVAEMMIERSREPSIITSHTERATAPAAEKHNPQCQKQEQQMLNEFHINKPKYSMTGLPINLLEKLKKKQLQQSKENMKPESPLILQQRPQTQQAFSVNCPQKPVQSRTSRNVFYDSVQSRISMDSNECTTKSKQSSNNFKSKSSKTRRTTRKTSANSRPAQLPSYGTSQPHSASLKLSRNASDKGSVSTSISKQNSNQFKRNLSQLQTETLKTKGYQTSNRANHQAKKSSINQFVQKMSTDRDIQKNITNRTSTAQMCQLHDKLDKQVSTTQKLEVFMDKHKLVEKLKKSQQYANTTSHRDLNKENHPSTTKRSKNFCPVRQSSSSNNYNKVVQSMRSSSRRSNMHKKSKTSYIGNGIVRKQQALEATFIDDTSANDEMNDEPNLVTGKSFDGTAPQDFGVLNITLSGANNNVDGCRQMPEMEWK